MNFSLFLPLNTTLDITYKIIINILEGEEKKADSLGLQDLRNSMVVNSTSFILTTYIPDWLLEEP